MPAAMTGSTTASMSDIQVLYERLTKVSNDLNPDTVTSLRIALSRAGAAEAVITQEPPPVKKRKKKVKIEPDENADIQEIPVTDEQSKSQGSLLGPSTSSSTNGLYPSSSASSAASSNFTQFTGSYTPSTTGAAPTFPARPTANGYGNGHSNGSNSVGPVSPAIGSSNNSTNNNNNSSGPQRRNGDRRVSFAPDRDNTVLGPDDVPPPPPHPTDPMEIRKLVRSKMHRCKQCKNRFVELNLYERHLKERHPDEYILFMEEQAREMELQRQAEIEQVKREEILSGGFIPPLADVDAELNYSELDPNTIPLPGEETGGIAPTFDRWGGIRMPRRRVPYKKKISPQCPFCDKRFRNENSLKKHVAKKHPECLNFVQCNKCFKCLPTQDDLEEGAHECTLCYLCYECTPIRNMCTQNRLDSHRSKFHRGRNSGFQCRECNRKFLTPRKLRKHRKMSHIITKPWKCSFCDEYFPTETTVSLHERIHTGVIKFECNICDFRSNRYLKLKTHKQEEHGYLCSICHEKMTEWSELKYHTLEQHGGYLSSESQAVCIESPRVWVLYKGE